MTPTVRAIAAEVGQAPEVTVYNTDGTVKFELEAYDSSWTGGMDVAVGDVNHDGVSDIITGALAGGGPHVKVFDGTTGRELYSFFAYDQNFRGGVSVVSADLNGDGFEEIITGALAGGGPHVKVFDGKTGRELYSFFAYDVSFQGGVELAVGDVNGDGTPDIITGAGPGGGPHVKVFDGKTMQVLRSFYAYDQNFHGGVFLAAGDLNDDGYADIVTGAGPGGGPHVEVFDGKTGGLIRSFYAFDAKFSGGVNVAINDVTGDGSVDLVVSQATGGTEWVAFDIHDNQPEFGILHDFEGGERLASND